MHNWTSVAPRMLAALAIATFLANCSKSPNINPPSRPQLPAATGLIWTGPPDQDETTLEAAQAEANFELILPSAPLTDMGSSPKVYMTADASEVDLVWNAPQSDTALDQYLIQVDERGSNGLLGTRSELEADISSDPLRGKKLTTIKGIDVLELEANINGGGNVAVVRFLVNNTYVEVSGGDNLAGLVASAESIINAASAAG